MSTTRNPVQAKSPQAIISERCDDADFLKAVEQLAAMAACDDEISNAFDIMVETMRNGSV